MSSNLIVPTPQLIREETETIPNSEVQKFVKCLYMGCGRGAEFAHYPCNGEKAYGTVGKGYAWKVEYQPQTIEGGQLAMAMASATSAEELRAKLGNLLKPVPAVIFKIPIAKKHRYEGEPLVYRFTAMPWEKKYEPWTQEIYEYYQQRGKEPLFPHNRKHYLDYLRLHGIFKKFCYPIERYTIRESQGIIQVTPESDNPLVQFKQCKNGETAKFTTIPKHYKPFKLHGNRHIRTGEYINFYKIKENLNLCSLVGWAPRRGPESMIERYGNIYESWESYFPMLLKEH